MPYIKQENRPKMNEVIEALHEDWLFGRELIYILFEYCKQNIQPSYNKYKNFCGELRQCATEIERRTGAKEISIVDVDANFKLLFKFAKDRLDLCNKKIEFMKDADIQVNGDLNYILYGYCIRYITTEYWEDYNKAQYSEFAKELRLAAKKITKEILAPYEDTKIIENGDVL